MPGLVLSAMINPFKRVPRCEYVYGPTGYEALDPIAPLLDDTVYDNIGLLVVGDQYSVWPEAGIFPKVTDYQEVLEKLRSIVERRCGIRLSPRLCKRVRYVIVPWSQLVGGWRFMGTVSDAEAFIAYSFLDTVARSSRRIGKVIVVLDPDADTGLSYTVLLVGKVIAAIKASSLTTVLAEARPYPPSQGISVRLYELENIGSVELLRELVNHLTSNYREVLREPLLVQRTPLARRKSRYRLGEEEELTIATALAAVKRYYTLLVYQACGAVDPVKKLRDILENATRYYIEATQVVKKRVGGVIAHHVLFSKARLRALFVGSAIESQILGIIQGQQSCKEIYSQGVKKKVLSKVEDLLGGGDETPREYTEDRNGYIRLKQLRELRKSLLS